MRPEEQTTSLPDPRFLDPGTLVGAAGRADAGGRGA